jgi:hypothetical protein
MRIPPEAKFPVAGAQRQGTALLRSFWLAGSQETLVEEPPHLSIQFPLARRFGLGKLLCELRFVPGAARPGAFG